jgi:dTDP-D-glucose 4,6-dehydratase
LKKLGWKPTHTLADHLPKTVLWYKYNQGWIKKTTARQKKFNTHIHD